MTKITKSILKFILPLASLGLFLVASIVVLIISQGQKLEESGQFIQTGIIRITSIPADNIKAYINDEEVQLSDFRITGINPGIVNLRLSKEGYSPWEKQIKVESGIVKDVFAQLYPNTVPFSKIAEQNISKSFYSADGQYIYYTVLNKSALDGIWRIKLSRNLLDFSNTLQRSQIVRFTALETEELLNNSYNLLISSNNNKLILQAGSNNYLYNLSDTTKRTNLNQQLNINTTQELSWFKEDQSIIFKYDNYYFEYDLVSQQISLVNLTESDSTISVTTNTIYFIRNNKLYYYTNKAIAEYKFTSKLVPFIPNQLDNVYTVAENPNILVLSTNNTLYYVDLQKEFVDVIDTTANFYKGLSNGRLILYTKNNSLHSYYTEDNFNANTLDTFNYSLNISLEDFDNLEFASTGKNIVFFKNNKATIMDYDGLNAHTLLEDFKFVDNKLLFANNNTEIYALIQEKDATGLEVNNIYKFELKLK